MWSLGAFLLFFLLILSGLFSITDPDFWWHLRTGQLIYQTGQVPNADPFSFTAAGKPWMSHEWLAEWLIYLLVSRTTYWGGLLFFGFLSAGTFWLLNSTLKEMHLSPALRLLLLGWAAIMTFPFLTVRPRVFTIFFFALFLSTIVLYHRGQRVHWWLLPIAMIIWANVHAGYVAGLGLLGLLFIAEALQGPYNIQIHRRLRIVGIIFVVTLLASLATPHGFKILLYPFTYLKSKNASSLFIAEWQSPDFHHPRQWLLLAALLVSMGSGLVWQKRDWLPFLLLGSMTIAVLHAGRYVPLFAITWVIVEGEWLTWHWPTAIEKAPTLVPLQQAWRNCLTFILLIALAIGSLPLFAAQGRLQTVRLPRTDGQIHYPAASVAWLQANRPHARMFNKYAWGGYLIYRLWPEQKVFIDGRADMYGNAFITAYYNTVTAQPGWNEFLDQWDVDTALLTNDTPLSAVLTASATWQKVFSTSEEVIFIRKEDH